MREEAIPLRLLTRNAVTGRHLEMMFYYLQDQGDTGRYEIKTEIPLKWLGVDIQEEISNKVKPVAIPAGVRLAQDVPDEECKKCNLDTEDHTVNFSFPEPSASASDGVAYRKVCLKDYRAIAKQERANEHEVDREDLGEQELLSFQFKYCDGCQWADQEKVGTGHTCCTFITTPHIVDGECRTRKLVEVRQ